MVHVGVGGTIWWPHQQKKRKTMEKMRHEMKIKYKWASTNTAVSCAFCFPPSMAKPTLISSLSQRQMEKVCEFCTVVQPVIYCTADAAFLCLSCDAKVHSANAVSNKHFRTLLCEMCRNQLSYVRCMEHRTVMCHSCERTVHEVISHQHETRSISSYAGCPSANYFAKLWGFNVNELDNVPVVDQAPMKKQIQKKTSMIMQQILELRRLQVSEGSSTSSVIRREGKLGIDPSLHNTPANHDESSNHCTDDISGPVVDLEKADSPNEELNGDPFWQGRSPCGNSQFWSQNLQELGVCEEFDGFDDFNMSDMDGSFCDFEDLFGVADQEGNSTLFDGMDASWPSIEKDVTADMSIHKPVAVGKHSHPSDKGHLSSSRSVDSLLRIQHSSSASFSLSAENISNHCLDFLHSGINMGEKPSYACMDVKSKGSVLKRCKGRTARPHKHRVQLALHKGKAETNKRGNSDWLISSNQRPQAGNL
ncbi:putative zinc finger protein [Drosera capensis]